MEAHAAAHLENAKHVARNENTESTCSAASRHPSAARSLHAGAPHGSSPSSHHPWWPPAATARRLVRRSILAAVVEALAPLHATVRAAVLRHLDYPACFAACAAAAKPTAPTRSE